MSKRWLKRGLILIGICGIGLIGYILGNSGSGSEFVEGTAAETDDTKESPHKNDNEDGKKRQTIIQETQSKVVKVELADETLGSGFLYNEQGDVITNAHVVAGAEEATVTTADSEHLPGKVIGISGDQDVAVVRVEGLEGEEPLDLATEQKAEAGQDVLALGSPFGLENTVTTGIISGINRDLELGQYVYEEAYQISAPIAPGNSGGPLLDSATGKVLGINAAAADEGSIGFSIPIYKVIDLVEGWSEHPMTSLPSAEDERKASEAEPSETSDEALAAAVVNDFYDRINAQDYEAAYALLGNDWQESLPFQTFYNGYLDTLSVTIDNMTTISKGDTVEITSRITAKELADDGSIIYNQYQLSYQAGYENNEMTLLSGESELI